MILLFSGIHSLSLQHAYFPLSVSLNFHLTSGYKNNLLSLSVSLNFHLTSGYKNNLLSLSVSLNFHLTSGYKNNLLSLSVSLNFHLTSGYKNNLLSLSVSLNFHLTSGYKNNLLSLSVSLNFHLTSGYKNNLLSLSVSKYCFTFPELRIFEVVALDPLPMVLTLRLQESSVYGYQFIRGFLKKDLMSTSEPSSFLLFIVFFFLVGNF